MSFRLFLVDGYNIVNNWLEAKFLAPGDLDFARSQLINHLASCFSYWGTDCWLVFDAHLVKGGRINVESETDHLQVIYTAEGQTADSFIERAAAEMQELGRPVVVCTSDWAEQNIALTRGASRLSARDLLWRVRQAEADMSNLSKNPQAWQKSWLEDNLPPDVRNRLRNLRDKKK
jgi:hypothetical protein